MENTKSDSYGTFTKSTEQSPATFHKSMEEEESVSEQDSIDSPLPNVSRWEFYEILGVSRDVDAEELKQKRKKLALRYHPDKNRGKEEEAQVCSLSNHI